jgi:hypothetical protein
LIYSWEPVSEPVYRRQAALGFYRSLLISDNEKLSQLVNLNLEQKPYTADTLAATVTKVLEQNQN